MGTPCQCKKLYLWSYQRAMKFKTVQIRTMSKMPKPRNPEIAENLPIFEYATSRTKPTKRLYIWGNSMFGCLGNPNFVKPLPGRKRMDFIHRPIRLKFADENRVQDAACGNGFTIFAATTSRDSYRVFGTGLNTDSQIGYQCNENGRPMILLAAPVPIHIPFEYESTKVKRVAAGRAHTIVLTDAEGAFSLGNNSFGQCGRPVVPNENYEGSHIIHKIQGLPDNIVDVVCGQDHTLFLSKDGQVWSCGWGADGQTGIPVTGQGHNKSCGTPRRVVGDVEGEKIVHVDGCVDCTLAVSEKGDVFGWGNSEYCQLSSVTNEKESNVSRHLPFKNVGKIVQAAAGGTMCAILNDKGQVYVWGYGLLGQGPNAVLLEKPSLLPEPLFGLNEFNPDARVSSISCGLTHFAAITNKKDLYMWGKNHNACLGFGHSNDQYFPFRVSIPAAVDKVSCGADHSLVLCRAFV